MQGQIDFRGITRRVISIWYQTFPIAVCNLKSKDFRDYSVLRGNNQSFRVFPENNGKTEFNLAVKVIVHPQITHKDEFFSGEHGNPIQEEFNVVCDITHILTKVISFAFDYAFFLASLQVCWWVFMGKKEQVRERERFHSFSHQG